VTHLNGAQSGAKIEDVVTGQIKYISNQILTTYNESIDMEKDWKFMTVFIGANNLCGACEGKSDSSPDFFEAQFREILTQIEQLLPRTFVNVLLMFNVSQAYDIAMSSDYCYFMWDTICSHECGCMTDLSKTEKDRKMMDLYATEYNRRIYKVVAEWEAKKLPGMAVKIQPFFENMSTPKSVGTMGVSELDCFHPSALADAGWALAYWNSLWLPDSKKPHYIPENISFICPTVDSFLQ